MEGIIMSKQPINPKALYALIAIVALISLIKAVTGEDAGQVQVRAPVTSGQGIILDNPNGGLSHLTVSPGLMNAVDSEDDSDQSVCTVPPGTHGIGEEEQVVGLLPFVKVKVTDGECQGQTGWTSKINLK